MAGKIANNQIFLSKLTEIILANLGDENFGVNELARESGMSHQILRRRLHVITNKTITQFIRETRLNKALELLQNEYITASEVAYKVGFSSPAYFNTCFHEFFGYPPGQVTKTIPGSTEEINYFKVTIEKDRKGSARKTLILASFIILFLTGTVFLVYYFLSQSEKSVAVLPFKNLSDSTANQYYIEGIEEEINSSLSKIHDLRLISRTSVEQFRESDRSAVEIAGKLNVNYIVEGSVQWYGNIFRIWVQLIKATRKERHLWANTYEQEIRDTKDLFRIQSRVAQDIATGLKAKVTAQEEDFIQIIPTVNSLAWDYYIRGKKYKQDAKHDSAMAMFSKAIIQDTGFVSAYLERASLYSVLYFTKGDYYYSWGDWKDLDNYAKADLEMCLKINPNSPEVKLEQAEQLYMFDRNYEDALALVDEINDQMPNNPNLFALRGYILRRKGEWEESLKEMYKAISWDPLNPDHYNETGHTFQLMRRYSEALEFYNKAELLDTNWANQAAKFFTSLLWKGDLEEALKISGLSQSQLKPGGLIGFPNTYSNFSMDLCYNYFYHKKQFEKIIPVADKFEDQHKYIPKTLNLAQLYFLNSNNPMSRKYADSAIVELNLKVNESPADERYYSALGYSYAYKGEKSEAIENAKKAVRLMPLKSEAWKGYVKELDLAKIYILTGEYDPGMDIIERLLTIPGELSVPLLKIDPLYDKMRDLSRFKKILTTEYKTKF